MKLLESTRFEAINNALSITTGDSTISGRIESYSCKLAGGDKAMYKRFSSEQGNREIQALSPPQTQLGMSPGQSNFSTTLAIVDLNWRKLHRVSSNFNLKIIYNEAGELILHDNMHKNIIRINNIADCLANEIEPEFQYLQARVKSSCISTKAWLDDNHYFHYENIKISNVFAVCVHEETLILARVIKNVVQLHILDRNKKIIVHKQSVITLDKFQPNKLVVKISLRSVLNENHKHDGFVIINGKCIKFSIYHAEIQLDCEKTQLNLGNISDVIFPNSLKNEYYLLTKQSNLYHYCEGIVTKITCGINWLMYCCMNDNTFIVSDGLYLYHCVIDKDHKVTYYKLKLLFIASIAFVREQNIAICRTANNRFYKISFMSLINKAHDCNYFMYDAENIQSTMNIGENIEENYFKIDCVSKNIENQNVFLSHLAVITHWNVSEAYIQQCFRIYNLGHLRWNVEFKCNINSDLYEDTKSWFHSINYLNNKIRFINYISQSKKSGTMVTVPCQFYSKHIVFKSNIHELLVDNQFKIAVKIDLPRNYLDMQQFIIIKSPNLYVHPPSMDLNQAIDKISIGSKIYFEMYSKEDVKVFLRCKESVNSLRNYFTDKLEYDSDTAIEEIDFLVGSSIVKLKQEENYTSQVSLSGNSMIIVSSVKKHLIKRLQRDSLIIKYFSQDRLRLANAIRLLKTETMKARIDQDVLKGIKLKIRERISTQFIYL